MIHRKLPQGPNKAKEEYNLDLNKLDKGFSVLENIAIGLKVTDGGNSQLDSVVIKKRQGTIKKLDTNLSKITTQLAYNDDKTRKHIITDGTTFLDGEDGSEINIPITTTGYDKLSYISTNSVKGDVLHTGRHSDAIIGDWETIEYDYNTDMTKLTDSDANWEDKQLILRYVIPDENNESIIYDIVDNGKNWIKVKGDIKGLTTTTSSDITTSSDEIEVGSTEGFPTSGGSLKIGTEGDEFYYDAIDGNKFVSVTGISKNYPSGTKITSGITRAYVDGTYKIKYPDFHSRIVDTEKDYKSGSGGELRGKYIRISHGSGKGQIRKILSNTKDTINVDIPFSPLPDTSSKYEVYDKMDKVLYVVNGDNQPGKFDGTTFSFVDSIGGKYIEEFQGKVFVGNINYVVPDDEILKSSKFVSSSSDKVYVNNVDNLPDSGKCEIVHKDGTIDEFTYGSINTTEKYLGDINGLDHNIEKDQIVRFISKRRYGTASDGGNNTLTDNGKKFETDKLKDMYLVLVNGTGAGQMKKIVSNTETELTVESNWDTNPDNTTEYEVHTHDKYTVMYTEENDPENFNVFTKFITPPGNDIITGIKAWNDKLIIFKERSIWSVTFTYNTQINDWTPIVNKVSTDTGCAAGTSIIEVEDQIWYFNGTEYKSLGFSETQIGVIKTDSISFQINDMLKDVLINSDSDIAVIYNDKKFYFAPTNVNNKIFVYDYKYNAWITYTGLNIKSFYVDDKFVLYYGGNDGALYKFVDGVYTDNNTPIKTIIETKSIDLGNGHIYKRFMHGAFVFENAEGTVNIKLMINSASQIKVVEKNQLITGTTIPGGYGTNTLGDDNIGEGGNNGYNNEMLSILKVAINKKGVTMKIRISNEEAEPISLTAISFVYQVMKEQMFPSKFIR